MQFVIIYSIKSHFAYSFKWIEHMILIWIKSKSAARYCPLQRFFFIIQYRFLPPGLEQKMIMIMFYIRWRYSPIIFLINSIWCLTFLLRMCNIYTTKFVDWCIKHTQIKRKIITYTICKIKNLKNQASDLI